MMKRMLSLLLCMAMIMTMLPAQAIAQETAEEAAELVTETEVTSPVTESTEETNVDETVETVSPTEEIEEKTSDPTESIPADEVMDTITDIAGYAGRSYEDEPNGDIDHATDIFGLSACFWGELSGRDVDYFAFVVPVLLHTVTIKVQAVYGDFSLSIFDSSGHAVGYAGSPTKYGSGDYRLTLEQDLGDGLYYLCIRETAVTAINNPYEFTFEMVEYTAQCFHVNAYKSVTKPTCVDYGYTTYSCHDCGKKWRIDYTEPTGVHTYTDGQDTTCNVCGATREPVYSWTLVDGTLTISGTGKMEYTTSPWKNSSSIKKVVIEEGVTDIGEQAFYGCSELTSVTIPDTVQTIGKQAFYNCSSLTNVTFMHVSEIGKQAFYDCDALQSILIPGSVSYIASEAFGSCSSLKNIFFVGSAPGISSDAFFLVTANAYYRSERSGWTITAKNDYMGRLNWIAATLSNCPHPYLEILKAVSPTCTATGLTEGARCIMCKKIMSGRREVPALGHSIANGICTRCGAEACRHTHQALLPAVAATCTETGLTEGSCCTLCNEILVAQEVVPALGHNWENDICTRCGEVLYLYKGTCGTNAHWGLDRNGVLTIGGTGSMSDFYYRSTLYESLPPWYEQRELITKVVIADGITSIGTYAFYECVSLSSVAIPESMTRIRDFAFRYCSALNGITIPGSVENIGDYAFADCTELDAITISEGVTKIGEWSFSGCTSLGKDATLVLPDSLRTIGRRAFLSCSNLQSITIPRSVSSIGEGFVMKCTFLEEIQVASGNRYFSAVDGILLSKDGLWLLSYPCGKADASYVVPGGITRIGESAFYEHPYLKEIILPGSLELIYDSAFSRTKMEKITIPASVTAIGGYVFRDCDRLKNVTFLGKPPAITDTAFFNVTATAYYPVNNTSWTGSYKKSYGGTLTWKGYRENCKHSDTGLLEAVAPTCTGSGLTEGTYCTACSKILVAQEVIPSLGGHVEVTLEAVAPTCTETGLTEGVGCSRCDKIFVIQNTIPALDHKWDEGFVNLEPTENTEGQKVFTCIRCAETKTETIPALGHTYSSEVIAPTCTERGYTIYTCACGDSYQDNYVNALGHNMVDYRCTRCGAIDYLATGTCGESATWALERNGTLTISGTGAMTNYSDGNNSYSGKRRSPWYSYNDKITNIVINAGITEIGDYAFYYCSMTDVIIPEGVTSIGDYAFYYCRNMTDVIIPEGVTYIGCDAFHNCFALKTVIIPEGVSAIKSYTFKNCTGLEDVTIPDGVTYIGYDAFYRCILLTNVAIPDGVTTVDQYAFYECNNLTDLIIPDSVTRIGYRAFDRCDRLSDIYYGGSQNQWFGLGSSRPSARYIHYSVTDAANHWYQDLLDATCTQDGYIRETCNCLYERNKETKPKQGHNYVDGICTNCGEADETIVEYTYGQNVQIKLIEPWGIRANAKISTDAGVVDYNSLYDYGVYFIRKSALDRAGLTQSTITVADIVNDADAQKQTKADGVTISSGYLSAIYDNDIYTYELDDSVFVMFYFITEEGADPIYVPVRERNLKDLAQQRMNDATNFPNELERTVYQKMTKLETDVTDYRSDFANLSAPETQKAPTLAQYPLGPQAAGSQYTYGQNAQIKLIEPWGLKANVKVSKSGSVIDYSAVEEYGIVVLADNSRTYADASEILQNQNAYVFSSKNGDATISSGYISATYSKDIFTYQLDTDIYVFGYVKDADGYHYGPVRKRNVHDLMIVRKDDAANFPNVKERTVYADMIELYKAITAYREDYFRN